MAGQGLRLPLKYNLASLTQRKMRSMLTAGGIALTIFLAVLMVALSRGLIASTANSGSRQNAILLSKGAETLEFSAIDPATYALLRGEEGLAKGKDPVTSEEVALISPEAYISSLMSAPGIETGHEPRGVVRGVWPLAQLVHANWKIVEGQAPQRGFQIAVGQLAATKLGMPAEALALGKSLTFEGHDWKIVGVFEAPGTVLESEIWADLDDVLAATKRDDYSLLTMRAVDNAAADSILEDLRLRSDVRVDAKLETDYYSMLATQLKPVQAVSVAMTVILVLGGMMAGMNTMFTSIAGRSREMGVLLVMGYKRRAVLGSFLLESILLCLAGGLAGSAAGMFLNGIPMKIPMGAFRFAVDAQTMLMGLAMALLIGIAGGLLPVARVSRMKIVDALKSN